jgi:fatty acid desaturase
MGDIHKFDKDRKIKQADSDSWAGAVQAPAWVRNRTDGTHKDRKINWYRSKVDPKLMSDLMQTSDWHGFRQALGHLGLYAITGTLAYLAYRQIHANNWLWSVPLLLMALVVHGTVGSFLGGTACHELSHKTPFRSKGWNEFFLKVFAFLGWWDHVWFRPSHIKHHQLTVHNDYDGEVVLPQKFSLKDWKFWLGLFAWNPQNTWNTLKTYYQRATGHLDNDWYEFVLPESNSKLRRDHCNWARFALIGHTVLAIIFILTGHWFLIILVTFGSHYCGWLGFLCGFPQHFGLSPNVPDHRLCCRTYTCSWFPSFLYWNMQYHVEHHMFPAVPFFNLPKLRRAIEHDLPPAPYGLWATWKGMLEIHKKQIADPNFCFIPPLPQSVGVRAEDNILEREAALTNLMPNGVADSLFQSEPSGYPRSSL